MKKNVRKSIHAMYNNDAATLDPEEDGEAGTQGDIPAKRKAGRITGNPGQHVRPVVLEAMAVLAGEGYVVGRITNPAYPFDLMGVLDRAYILVKAVRAKCPVRNATETAKNFCHEIRQMQPFWNRDADNLQFWVFSKVAGLLRYRVYRGGIWNEATRKAPESQEPLLMPFNQRMRSASFAAVPAGLANGPD